MMTKKKRECIMRKRRIRPPSRQPPVTKDIFWQKRCRWRTLRGLWHFAHYKMPGTPEDCAAWLGAPSVEWLEKALFVHLEQLPRVKKNLRSLGGSFSYVKGYWWKWQARHEKMIYIGTGLNYNQAALKGLVTFWELAARRVSKGQAGKEIQDGARRNQTGQG